MVGEVYYMALVKNPKRDTFFDMFLTRLPTTRVFALEVEKMDKSGEIQTGMYELTVRARNVRIGPGCDPVLDTFHKSVLKILKIS